MLKKILDNSEAKFFGFERFLRAYYMEMAENKFNGGSMKKVSRETIGSFLEYCILVIISINIVVIFLSTFDTLNSQYGEMFFQIEQISLIIFIVEYSIRTALSLYYYRSLRYNFSFLGIIDLLAITPVFFGVLASGRKLDFRILRVVRLSNIFRIFKLNRYLTPVKKIAQILHNKKDELIASLVVIFFFILFTSLLMYYLEHDAQPKVFANALSGIWWSVETMTTVGYGDIYPVTLLGKILSVCIILLGLMMFAIPASIITSGFIEYNEVNDEGVETEDKKGITKSQGKK